MSRYRIATGLYSVLILAISAPGQSSAMPATPAASHKKQNATCRLPTTEEPTLFDVGKYFPPGAGVHAARILSAPDPVYPEEARKANLNGNVVVALAINETGGIDDVKVACSSDRRFEQSVIAAVKQWEFAPATRDGTPAAVQIIVETEFRLH